MLFADIVWPALVLEGRILTWWAIGAGLVAEFLVLRFVLNMNNRSAILANVQMNLVSSVAGILLIPLAGIVWEIFPGMIINSMLNLGTFNPYTWGPTIVIAVLVNTMIEWGVLRFAQNVRLELKVFLGLFLGNLVSVGLAFASLLGAIIRRPNGPPLLSL